MYQNLNLFQISAAMAQHAGTRQAVVASNIANADTPDFQSMEMSSFRDVYSDMKVGKMYATRPGHLGGSQNTMSRVDVTASHTEAAPNGNTVSIEDEMLNAVSVSREHSRALAIYRHGMTVIRATLGRN